MQSRPSWRRQAPGVLHLAPGGEEFRLPRVGGRYRPDGRALAGGLGAAANLGSDPAQTAREAAEIIARLGGRTEKAE